MLTSSLLNEADQRNELGKPINFTHLIDHSSSSCSHASNHSHSKTSAHTSTHKKGLIIDTSTTPSAEAALALSTVSPTTSPIPYLSLQHAREQSTLRLLCLPLKPCLLVFICFLTFGSYWVYDIPGALSNQLTQWFGGPSRYTPAMNANLYSVYSCRGADTHYSQRQLHPSTLTIG